MRFDRFADTNGDGTGIRNANVDGSVTPVVFKLAPLAAQIHGLDVNRMIVTIKDGGTLDSGSYGNGINLSAGTGVKVGVFRAADDVMVHDFLDTTTIKTTAEWRRYNHDGLTSNFGVGDELFTARWTFSKAGEFYRLDPDHYIGVTISDNLTGLLEHYFFFDGRIVSKRGVVT